MSNYRIDFGLDEIHYFDSATRSIAPTEAINSHLTSRDYNNSIYSEARNQSNLYLQFKEDLASSIDTEASHIALLPNREIAWNIVYQMMLDKVTTVRTTWSEETTILGPALYNYDVEFISNEAEDEDEILLAYSSIDPLTGEQRRFDQLSNGYTVIDASYDLSYQTLDDYPADVVIAELSIDMLAPFPLGVLIFDSDFEMFENPLPATGNVTSFDSEHIVPRTDIGQFELGTIDTNVLKGSRYSLQYLEEIGNPKIIEYRQRLTNQIIDELDSLDQVTILKNEFNSFSDHVTHLSISLPYPSHDVALLLDEMENVEVRSGRVCTHLATQRHGIDDVIRISCHIYNNEDDIAALITGLKQTLAIFG